MLKNMKAVTTLLLLAVLGASLAVASGGADPGVPMEGVIQFTKDTFYAQAGKEQAVFVEFYAPWCGHCKNMAEDYATLGATLQGNRAAQQKLLIGKVDATVESELGNAFDVKGFPTILYFPAGSLTPEKYQGGRVATDFVDFLNKKIDGLNLFVAREHQSATEVDGHNFASVVLDEAKDVLVMVHAPWCGHCKQLKPTYNRLAKIFQRDADSVVVAMLNGDEEMNRGLLEKYSVGGFPTLLFFAKGNKESPESYDGDRRLEPLLSYMNDKTGKKRLVDGDLSWDYGVDKALSAEAVKVVQKSGDRSAEKVLQAAHEKANGTVAAPGVNVEYYSKLFDRLSAEGKTYLTTELDRLKRMLAGSIAGRGRDDMLVRVNVLSSVLDSL